MENDKSESRTCLSHFDRTLGALHGLPDVVQTKPSTLRVVPSFGIGTHLYIVQTFRQRDTGDTIFLEHVSEGATTRMVIPAAVADAIARQRESITAKTRSRAMKAVAEDRMAKGIMPGFMKKKKK
jgi:hypothetical protein